MGAYVVGLFEKRGVEERPEGVLLVPGAHKRCGGDDEGPQTKEGEHEGLGVEG